MLKDYLQYGMTKWWDVSKVILCVLIATDEPGIIYTRKFMFLNLFFL